MSASDMNSEQPVASTFSAGPADRFAPAVTEVETGIEDNVVSVCQVNEHEELSQRSGWFGDDLHVAQGDDPDISYIMNLLEQSVEKPPWEAVTLHSHDVKVLWNQWSRLQIRNGVLCRRYESVDGLSVEWQVVLPTNLRREFLTAIHTGMSGGH